MLGSERVNNLPNKYFMGGHRSFPMISPLEEPLQLWLKELLAIQQKVIVFWSCPLTHWVLECLFGFLTP